MITLDQPTLKDIVTKVTTELTNAKNGQKTSFAFIPHTLPSSSLAKDDEPFQVLVIGGSVCKKAMVQKKGKEIEILSSDEKQQPVFFTKDDLFTFIEQELNPNAKLLALNFAYPLEPVFENGRLDGKLIAGSKENTFTGLVGQKVGQEIQAHVLKTQNRELLVTVANDTVCLLLSGYGSYSWNSLVCGIVGTGLNFALFINEKQLVNLEAANFDKFSQSDAGKDIDKASQNPGRALLEKETSGAYLYRHFNFYAKGHSIDSTKELTILAQENQSEEHQLAKDLLNYSASLVAAVIAGIAASQQTKELTFIMEGSLFWEGYGYKDTIEQQLKTLLPEKTISFKHVHHSSLVGTAALCI
jgi:hexokinase